MKTLDTLLFAFLLLLFSGCYVQFAAEDDDWGDGTYVPPPPPGPDPIPHPRPPHPRPPLTPVPVPNPIPQPVDVLHRESGPQRTGTNQNSDNSRNTGAQRSTELTTPQQTSQDNSHPVIPTRGNNPTQENSSQGRGRGR